jgi:methionine sulfoxide reductase heme-binding subunit
VRTASTKPILWAVLALPAAVLVARSATGEAPAELLPASGEWSARLIIAALMLTPLAQLAPANRTVRWLLRHRRAFGVAGFAYALLHLALYGLDMETVANMLAELSAPGIWTAWLALLCLLPPALASRDAAMRALGAAWKKVQRLVYPAAVLTLAHWLLVHDGATEALLHFAPLAALQLLRVGRSLSPRPLERKIA